MKYLVLTLIVMIHMSCAIQNSSTNEGNNMKDLITSNQPVYIQGQTFEDVIDFTSFVEKHMINDGVYQANINSGITFKNCVFNKPVTAFKKMENGSTILTSFQLNVSFIDCIFKDEVNFRGSSVYGRTDFTGSTFELGANFQELNCHENAFFNRSIFEGPLEFQNAFFNKKANFMNANYYDIVSFQSSLFNSELQLSASKFYKYADFTLVDCRGKVLFNYAEFMDRADLSHSVFFQDFDFISTQNNTASFNNCRFLGKVRFNKTVVTSFLSFKESYFLFGIPEINIPADKLILSK